MTTTVPLPLKFQVGARTLLSVRRNLRRVPLGLDDVRAGYVPALPPLGGADGYLVTSLPEASLDRVVAPGCIRFVRQRYTRYYADLTIGFDAWWSGLSSNTRSGLKRKAKRLGASEIQTYRTTDEIAEFHAIARRIAVTTYQERLMGAGIPGTPEFVAQMLARAAADGARGWILSIDGEPAAYLYCPIRGGTVIYEYVGHDPRFADLSPGAVLQMEAMRDLYAEAWLETFDFTEGEGQHKRSMATGGVPCVDVLLLRPTPMNRMVVTALGGFDRAVALAKAAAGRWGLQEMAKRLRRG